MKKQTKTIIILAAIALIVLALVGSVIKTYNNLVTLDESVSNKYAAISTQLQRRADLIPNLVNTVKGYTNYETEIFTKIAEARSNLLAADSPKEAANANQALTQVLAQVLSLTESYPALKGDQQFTSLMDELAGTENRIAVARKDYNDVTYKYNTEIKIFPNNLLAGMFGFDKKDYFEADEEANKVPDVSFE